MSLLTGSVPTVVYEPHPNLALGGDNSSGSFSHKATQLSIDYSITTHSQG
jgi:hypothetical protein